MNNPTQLRVSSDHPDAIIERHAATVNEIRQMHERFEQMRAELSAAYRQIDQQQNKIEMLEADREKFYQEARVFQRKLIRLCAVQGSIGKLAAEAMEIMTSVKDWEETEEHAEAEKKSAAELVHMIRGAASDAKGS